MSKVIDQEIREEYAQHRSLFKTAKKLGIEISYVKTVVESMPEESKPDLATCRWEGFGDPDKKAFLVARNSADRSWDNSRPEVAKAREDFEAGTHDMATGRDGPFILLYSFPRAVRQPRPGYFNPVME